MHIKFFKIKYKIFLILIYYISFLYDDDKKFIIKFWKYLMKNNWNEIKTKNYISLNLLHIKVKISIIFCVI